MNMVDSHRGSLFLRHLPDHDLMRLTPHLRVKGLAPGEVLHRGGDIISKIVFPHDGVVSLVCTMADGTAAETAVVGREGYVGTEVMLGSAVAATDALAQPGQASSIALDRLQFLTDQSPSLRASLLAYARNFLVMINRQAACNALHSTKQRICRRLLLADDHTGHSSVPITQEFLARALAVRRSSINLICGELRRNGLIEHSRGWITITDRARMEQEACECYVFVRNMFRDSAKTSDFRSHLRDRSHSALPVSATGQNNNVGTAT